MNLTPVPIKSTEPDSVLLYSAPKCGKSTLLSRLPGHYIFSFDRSGYNALSAAYDYYDGPDSFEKGVAELTAIVKGGSAQTPKYIGIDTVDKLEDYSALRAVDSYRKRFPKGTKDSPPITDVADLLALPFGLGYGYLRNAFMAHLLPIAELGIPVVFAAHVRPKVMDSTTQEANSKDLALTGKCCLIICGLVDVLGCITRSTDLKGQTTLHCSTLTQSTGAAPVNCGSRFPYLSNKLLILARGTKEGAVTTHWEAIFPSLAATSPTAGGTESA